MAEQAKAPRKYILIKGEETVEVLEGREGRRDQLIQYGYEWTNKAEFEPTDKPAPTRSDKK